MRWRRRHCSPSGHALFFPRALRQRRRRGRTAIGEKGADGGAAAGHEAALPARRGRSSSREKQAQDACRHRLREDRRSQQAEERQVPRGHDVRHEDGCGGGIQDAAKKKKKKKKKKHDGTTRCGNGNTRGDKKVFSVVVFFQEE
uniref:Uncharacterized protein n=1 Tax=Setaria viridis TaxID=4556 RepID=A0A4U6T0G8_SETVI|nr:hypothetical protein SEVIR_9G328750v2 [Setaria viridis]